MTGTPEPLSLDIDRAPMTLAIVWTWFALSTIVVGMRLFARAAIVRHVGIDDYLIVGALVICHHPKFVLLY